MARIRTIKPDFWQHPKVMSVSRDARLLFLGLLNEVDDEGRMRWSAKRVAGVVFPGDEDVSGAEVETWAGQLQAAGLIVRYADDHGPLMAMPGFTEHQRINRATPSLLPAPALTCGDAGLTEDSLRTHGGLTEDSLRTHGALTEDSLTEGNGREGNGSGRERIAVARGRDDVFEAIAEVCGIDWSQLTTASRGALNKAAAELRRLGADRDEICRRAANWPYEVPLTPPALAKHWPALGTQRASRTQPNAALVLAARLEAEGR